MKKSNKLKILLIVGMIFFATGCTQTLVDEDNKPVQTENGQTITENILCKPTAENTIDIYKEYEVDIESLPECENFSATTGGYEGLWETIFVKPLAFLILFIDKFVGNIGLALIIVSLLIRLIAYPITRKTALQSELIKKAQPEIKAIEKKFEGKNDQQSMMKKSQEMTLIYKKYNINPVAGCLYAIIQLPLFIAFLEAINRVPAIFEGSFLGLQLGTTPMIGFSTNAWWAYVLLLIVIGVSTYFSFSLNSTTSTSQPGAKMMPIIMNVVIIIMALFMPSALGIYWVSTNTFTIAQNLIVKRSKEANGKKTI